MEVPHILSIQHGYPQHSSLINDPNYLREFPLFFLTIPKRSPERRELEGKRFVPIAWKKLQNFLCIIPLTKKLSHISGTERKLNQRKGSPDPRMRCGFFLRQPPKSIFLFDDMYQGSTLRNGRSLSGFTPSGNHRKLLPLQKGMNKIVRIRKKRCHGKTSLQFFIMQRRKGNSLHHNVINSTSEDLGPTGFLRGMGQKGKFSEKLRYRECGITPFRTLCRIQPWKSLESPKQSREKPLGGSKNGAHKNVAIAEKALGGERKEVLLREQEEFPEGRRSERVFLCPFGKGSGSIPPAKTADPEG
eukprot:TRINITY_DN35085_c0_g1_i1.p1 TRINITY_DN35085_c0_g1~~TRINITY_DN35085_c0_g1_i1.p1  ORF type:complete len:302 (-),score=-21.78 TRINITY_DN35085_c0_g1_i1:101-1006(-)